MVVRTYNPAPNLDRQRERVVAALTGIPTPASQAVGLDRFFRRPAPGTKPAGLWGEPARPKDSKRF